MGLLATVLQCNSIAVVGGVGVVAVPGAVGRGASGAHGMWLAECASVTGGYGMISRLMDTL